MDGRFVGELNQSRIETGPEVSSSLNRHLLLTVLLSRIELLKQSSRVDNHF